MSHWIESPTLTDRIAGEELLSFRDPNWSLDVAEWVSDTTVTLTLRKYPGGHVPSSLLVTIDCVTRTAEVGGVQVPLRDVERAVDRALTWK